MNAPAHLIGILVLLGAGWGITLPMSKIAVSAGYQHFGLIFWQVVIGAVLMGTVLLARGKLTLPSRAQFGFATLVAVIGTLLPNTASYQAMHHLPSGVMSILLSLIPMIAFPIALTLNNETFRMRKLVGLALGLAAVIIITVNRDNFAGEISPWWIAVALIAPVFYAFEGNIVARWGTFGLDAMQVLFWASLIAIPPATWLALASGQMIDPTVRWGLPEIAVVVSSVAHVLVYTGYVWLVGRAGSVFAAQVSYLVTLFGIFWAVALLNESYSGGVWLALALMMTGLFMVQPRSKPAVEETLA